MKLLFAKEIKPATKDILLSQEPNELNRHIADYFQILDYLQENPEYFSKSSGLKGLEIGSETYYHKTFKKFIEARISMPSPSSSKSAHDPAVWTVMEKHYGVDSDRIKIAQKDHQNAMSSENYVGAMLERYIYNELKPYGWVHCSGDFVKAADFLLKTKTSSSRRSRSRASWKAIQVKNRNSTENSSSKQVRNGTIIEKWYRLNSGTGKTNWSNFPEGQYGLSEEKFQEFISSNLVPLR